MNRHCISSINTACLCSNSQRIRTGFRGLLFFLLAAFISALCAFGQATNAYVTSNGAAAGSCPSGSTTFTPAQFSTASTWGTGSSQIGPGTKVLLCGTITAAAGSTPLTLQGSGTSSSPITLQFDTGASLQAPYFSSNGAININGQSYVVINGGTNGVIEATANGTSGYSGCPSGSCSNQQNSQGIENFGNNDTVENLTIGPMYARTGTTDEAPASLNLDCIDVGTSSNALSNVTINNNVVHDCMNGIFFEYGSGGGLNFTVSNNTIYNVNWGFGTAGCTSGTNFSGLYYFGNHTYNLAVWDDTVGNDFHHNGIHSFQCNSSTATISNYYIYNNEFDGPVGSCCVTSQIYIDNNGTNLGFTSSYVFNNVFSWANGDCGNTCGNGQLGLFSGTGWTVVNNTFIGNAVSASSLGGALMEANQPSTSTSFLNNVMTTGSPNIWLADLSMLSSSPNYNTYANGLSGGDTFECQTNQFSASQFSSWVACIGNETKSNYYAADPLPNCLTNTNCSNVVPQSGSTVIQAATNLYSACESQPNPGLGALCYDKAGNARPKSGNWDGGAFQSSSSTASILPPTNVQAVGH